MFLRASSSIPSVLLLAVFLASPSFLSSCGGSDGGSGGGVTPDPDRVTVRGVVVDVTGEPLAAVPVTSLGTGHATRTTSDGSFLTTVSRDDSRVSVGSHTDTSFVVFLDLGDEASIERGAGVATFKAGVGAARSLAAASELEIARPFFVLEIDDGVSRPIGAQALTNDLLVDDPALEGLRLRIPAGTSATFPAGAEREVFIVGVAHDRLPLPFPDGRLARFAVFVGPRDLSFSAGADLVFPNADGLAPGATLDLVTLDETSGVWETIGEVSVDDTGKLVIGAVIEGGGWFAALPRTTWPRTTLRGRVLGTGNEPMPGFRVGTIGSLGTITGPNGFFEIRDVPVFPGAPIAVHVLAASQFRHSFLRSAAIEPVLGDAAPPPAPEDTIGTLAPAPVTVFGELRIPTVLRATFPPTVSFFPGGGATGVDEMTRIRVRFDRPMDLSTVELKLVRGISREQQGVEGTVFTRFVNEGTELELIPFEPLRNGVFYTIFVSKESRDRDGNVVDPRHTSSRFTVRDTPQELGPRDLRVFSVFPNEGIVGDDIELIGVNLSPERVTFGSVEAFVAAFDDRAKSFLQVRVPMDIAGEVPIGVRDLDGNIQGLVPFRALPILEAFGTAVVEPDDAGALVLVGVGAHLGTAPVVFWNGVPGATFESLPDGECAIFDPFLGSRRCFRLTLPRGPVAGVVFFEVGGVRTRGIFVVARAPLDDAAPTVVAASIADGSAAAADAQIVLRFSELLDGESRASVLVNGVAIEGERQELRHFSSGATELLIAPPVGGWPAGELSVIAGAEIVDLAGHRLDQDPGTAAAEDFELTLTIGG